MTLPGGVGNPLEMLAGLRKLAEAPVAQTETIVREIKARRAEVAAFQGQLAVLDEQLAALEAALQPLAEWGRAWSGMQQAMLRPLLPPSADPPPPSG